MTYESHGTNQTDLFAQAFCSEGFECFDRSGMIQQKKKRYSGFEFNCEQKCISTRNFASCR